jgi:hypothetical protein
MKVHLEVAAFWLRCGKIASRSYVQLGNPFEIFFAPFSEVDTNL